MVQTGTRRCSPRCRDHDNKRSSNGKCERSHRHESPYRQPENKAEMRSEHQPIARPKEVTHSWTSTSAASTHVPFNTFSRAPCRLSSVPAPASLVLQSKSELTSSPRLRGGRCPSHFVRERTNPGRCIPSSSRTLITICIRPYFEFHCRSCTNKSSIWLVKGDTWRSGLRGSLLGFPAKKSCFTPKHNQLAMSR